MALDFLSPIHKASRQISIYLRKSGGMGGLEGGEAHLLTYLVGYGPCTVGRLHKVFGFKNSTLTGMLDRLEKKNLVLRVPNPEDRRSFLVEATAAGRKRGAEIRAYLEAFEAEVRSHIGAEDLAGFRRVMKAIERVTDIRLDSEEE